MWLFGGTRPNGKKMDSVVVTKKTQILHLVEALHLETQLPPLQFDILKSKMKIKKNYINEAFRWFPPFI